MIRTREITVESRGNFETVHITDMVRDCVAEAGVSEGSVLVFYRHTTGALLMVEHEIGLLSDLKELLERIAPIEAEWRHHRRGYDQNGGAHLRSALLSSSLTVPILEGELLLGTYQEILLADFDPLVEPRTRKLIVQVAGE